MHEPRGRAHVLPAGRPAILLLGLMVVVAGCGSGLSPSSPEPNAVKPVVTYRGDAARTGEMPGPAPSGTPSVAWTFKAGAPITSSPLAIDGVVYVLDNDGVIHALALETGEERWQATLGEDASASPLISDGLLIVGDSAGVIHGLAVADGSVRWTAATTRSTDRSSPDGEPSVRSGRDVGVTDPDQQVALDLGPRDGVPIDVVHRQEGPGPRRKQSTRARPGHALVDVDIPEPT